VDDTIDTADPGPQVSIPRGKLWGVIVTFNRTEQLRELFAQISMQTQPPDNLIVVDNGSSKIVREVAEVAGATYIDAGANVGPAGAIALGMDYVLRRCAGDDWLMLFDDDDPPQTSDLIQRLRSFAQVCSEMDSRTAAVGLVGARYNPASGTFRRVPDEELVPGPVKVDYIGGGQFPTFRCRAIEDVGFFDELMFFGFDDAEYGLRLSRAGYSLYAHGEMWRASRESAGRLHLDRTALRTPADSAAWRRFYGARNITLIAWRYGSILTPITVSLASGFRGTLSLLRARRPLRDVVLPLRGAGEGLLRRSGKTIDPGGGGKTS